MNLTVALLSEHASPLAAVGGVDAGGQNIAVAELALHLTKLGTNVDVFTRLDDPALPAIVEWQPGIRVVHIEAGPVAPVAKEDMLPYMDAFTEQMIRFMGTQPRPYDLIHAHFFMSGYVACQIKARLGIPFAITFHALGEVRRQLQGTSDRFPADRFAIERQTILEADAVVALCPQDRQDMISLYGANPRTIVTIPNGFNPEQFYPVDKALARLMIGHDTPEPIILQLGRMVPRKGVDNVIRALGYMSRHYGIQARLLVVGGDSETPDPTRTPEIGRLAHLADEEGISHQVTFTGSRKREELRYYYSAADVFVTTPWYEPFGITPLESMACGTPVVGSAVGGIKCTVLDNETGFLVPPNQPETLAAKLAVLIHSKQLRTLLGEEAIRHVGQYYTWQHVAGQTLALYRRIAQNKSVGPSPIHLPLLPTMAPTDKTVVLAPKA
ncbi:glycosyltransferase family 4 protein [Rudanella lutea]|uniref:glycosyltransferase family 4 protein n=1 Tax=Rudanella lutea TaxID=451374 RepID=UPI0012F90974|nr:glycosyltransferase family 1 protein [Rudanella lutea]